jgi:hypothetical protein
LQLIKTGLNNWFFSGLLILKTPQPQHQEKPHLLICGNKFGSALVSKEQANFD